MPQKQNKNLMGNMEKLLHQQTAVILDAVDQKVGILDKRFNLVDREMLSLKKRLDLMEMRINQKIDRLITTLDKFLKRLTDIEDEFEIMKLDINRLKKVIREKLGIDLI